MEIKVGQRFRRINSDTPYIMEVLLVKSNFQVWGKIVQDISSSYGLNYESDFISMPTGDDIENFYWEYLKGQDAMP